MHNKNNDDCVDLSNDEYKRFAIKWKMIRDFIRGDVREYILPNYLVDQELLPTLPSNASDKQRAAAEANAVRRGRARNRIAKYKELAVYYNFTANTKTGLVGVMLARPPQITLPTLLEYLKEDATGNRWTLNQLIRICLGEIVEVGRFFTRTDFPAMPDHPTASQVNSAKPLPKIYTHCAEDVIDYGIDPRTGTDKLNMVLICERITLRKRLKRENYIQFRLMYLDDDGYYCYEILDSNGDVKVSAQYPKQNGKKLTYLPCGFIGAEDNDAVIDEPPLYPLVQISLGHLRNSANYEDNLDKHGQGTMIVTSSMSSSEWSERYGNYPLQVGSGEVYYLGQSGDMKLTQLQANQEAAVAMRYKEECMIALGAEILLPSAANAPVDTTRMTMGAKLSKAGNFVANVKANITERLQECAMFLGASDKQIDEINVDLSMEFVPQNADPAMLAQMVAGWQMGCMPLKVLFDYAKKTRIVPEDMTLDEYNEELADQSPLNIDIPVKAPSEPLQATLPPTPLGMGDLTTEKGE